MGKHIKEIDIYIESAKPFAQSILKHIRKLVHQACPEVEECIKWNFPHFSYQGLLCSMAAFSEHCAFGFWKGAVISDPHQILDKERTQGMGHLGRLTSLEDFPEEAILFAYFKEAMKLNEEGVKLPKKAPREGHLPLPEDFLLALKGKDQAWNHFEQFSNGRKNEYIEWIEEAKRLSTREKRIGEALQNISEGKGKNWKYE
ncbi:MAG: YdeI/OmpD-associated family protein [Verrucomicrobia bacterium]|nr:YdeI/OmpD-associated family protein [Verrucomicrobiota bacterium]